MSRRTSCLTKIRKIGKIWDLFKMGIHDRLKVKNGWIQTLSREGAKSQSLGNRTFNSETASKTMNFREVWVLECMCKCSFFQKTFRSFLWEKFVKNGWIWELFECSKSLCYISYVEHDNRWTLVLNNFFCTGTSFERLTEEFRHYLYPPMRWRRCALFRFYKNG